MLLTPDAYQVLQEEIGYPESYEAHTYRLVQGIPHNASTMVKHIAGFLERYPHFIEPSYVTMIEKVIEMLRADPDKHRALALRTLKAQFLTRDPNGRIAEDLPAHPPLFETKLGNQSYVLPTYGNPIMTAMYSLLFVCFARFAAQLNEPIE